ncbi:MAG: hypothetical protein CVU16_15585 [Betaproteobacteria bacterium HGW-Betaproteobacteria-10]|nr:MAG: hypothetical protein CVU16_15585 [Betaproteobacteria bacterium HGW-Betaproteobacteria-10]
MPSAIALISSNSPCHVHQGAMQYNCLTLTNCWIGFQVPFYLFATPNSLAFSTLSIKPAQPPGIGLKRTA